MTIVKNNMKLLRLLLQDQNGGFEEDREYIQKSEMYWMSQKEHMCNFVLARLQDENLIDGNGINAARLKQKGAVEYIRHAVAFNQIAEISEQFTSEEIHLMLFYLLHYLSIQQNMITSRGNQLIHDMINNFMFIVNSASDTIRRQDFLDLKCMADLYNEHFWKNSKREIITDIKVLIDFLYQNLCIDPE